MIRTDNYRNNADTYRYNTDTYHYNTDTLLNESMENTFWCELPYICSQMQLV